MQGYTHALTGAAGWIAVTSSAVVPASLTGSDIPLGYEFLDLPADAALAGILMCAGGALVPDMDHHNGTIAHSLPPVTNLMCQGVETASGGHRHMTHSLLGIIAATLLAIGASAATFETDGRTVALGAGIVAVFLVAFAIKALHIRPGRRGSVLNTSIGPWIIAVGTAGLATYFLDYQWTWLPYSMGLGALIHCLGDGLTVQGVPWLWPWNPSPPKALLRVPVLGSVVKAVWQPNGYFRVPLLGETNSIREGVFGAALGIYVVVGIAFTVTQLWG